MQKELDLHDPITPPEVMYLFNVLTATLLSSALVLGHPRLAARQEVNGTDYGILTISSTDFQFPCGCWNECLINDMIDYVQGSGCDKTCGMSLSNILGSMGH